MISTDISTKGFFNALAYKNTKNPSTVTEISYVINARFLDELKQKSRQLSTQEPR